MDNTPLKLSKESNIIQFRVRTKKIRPREDKGGFLKTQHATPFKICAFSVYLLVSNDIKFYMDGFYTSRAFQWTKNAKFGVYKRKLWPRS